MSEIEKIERYIQKTGISKKAAQTYGLYDTEMRAFYEELQRDWYRGMSIIFSFGQAKGYRAAKAESRK